MRIRNLYQYFSFLVNYLKNVYDVTIGYADTIVQSELDLIFRGLCPKSVHFSIKRVSPDVLDQKDDLLAKWLVDLWRSKEAKLTKFYAASNEAGRRFPVDAEDDVYQV